MINWFLNLDLYFQIGYSFIAGTFVGLFLMNIFVIVKNKKINIYQRTLEKESISSDENAAKVKVLEAKIEVLEKALENALNNK